MNQKKLNQIEFLKRKYQIILKNPSTKHFLKELSFLILLCPNTIYGTFLGTHFQKYKYCYKEKSEC